MTRRQLSAANCFYAAALLLLTVFAAELDADAASRKHRRAAPPVFADSEAEGVFYEDVASQLVGTMPKPATKARDPEATAETTPGDAGDAGPWKKLIDVATLEDLVKSSKKPLDVSTSSPAKFAGGGYQTSRLEFTKLATLLGVIGEYSGDVRWKHSALRAHQEFARAAANAKVGSLQGYNEAKAKNQLYNDLLNGTRLDAPKDDSYAWGDTLDRDAMMQLLEWTLRDVIQPVVNSEAGFTSEASKLQQYAQLAAVVGQVLQHPEMADADGEEYRQFAQGMIAAATAVRLAASDGDYAATRQAVSELDASCNRCHESYR